MRWEYHTVQLDTRDAAELRAHLNVLGAAGWELAACVDGKIDPATVSGLHALAQGALILVLKRPVKA